MKLRHFGPALALYLASCSGSGLGPELDLARNRTLWEDVGLDSYVYALERRCFCAAAGAARVTVESGEVVAVVWVDPEMHGTWQPTPEEFPDVDGLFDILAEAIERDAHSIEVVYDPATGVPTEFFIDYIEHAVDEELGMRIVEPVSPAGSAP